MRQDLATYASDLKTEQDHAVSVMQVKLCSASSCCSRRSACTSRAACCYDKVAMLCRPLSGSSWQLHQQLYSMQRSITTAASRSCKKGNFCFYEMSKCPLLRTGLQFFLCRIVSCSICCSTFIWLTMRLITL